MRPDGRPSPNLGFYQSRNPTCLSPPLFLTPSLNIHPYQKKFGFLNFLLRIYMKSHLFVPLQIVPFLFLFKCQSSFIFPYFNESENALISDFELLQNCP